MTSPPPTAARDRNPVGAAGARAYGRNMIARDPPPLPRRRALGLGLCLLAASPVAAQAPAFDLQGHRGTRGLAPENTLAAFARALSIGVTTLETDLAITKDGIVVLSHDPYLNPDIARGLDGRYVQPDGRNRGRRISTLTLAELKTYDIGRLNPASPYARQWPQQTAADGERYPTLAELVALTKSAGKPSVRFNLETKIVPDAQDLTLDPVSFARATVEAVKREGIASRTTIQSFDWRSLVEVKKLAPELETACLTIDSGGMNTVRTDASGASPWHAGLKPADHGGSMPKLVKAAGCGAWSMFWRNLTPELVREAKGLGLRILPWTVNDPADMRRLIEMGVDGIITDYPDRLRAAMAERGMRLP